MKRLKPLLYIAILSVLILDCKTAANGIREGIDLCLLSVIPALFPFLVITPMANAIIPNWVIRWIRPMGKLCGIPSGGESIFILGLLSGYPNGARMIAESWENKHLSRRSALRMLGFCNNAGPAFIFGVCGAILPMNAIWGLWFIHISSAIITAILLPKSDMEQVQLQTPNKAKFTSVLESAINTMGNICAWILIFKMVISFLNKYASHFIDQTLLEFIYGAMEITNGILSMNPQQVPGYKFIYISVFLAWGGLCVAAQTMTVTKKLGVGYYFPGKILQSAISFTLACGLQYIFFEAEQCFPISISLLTIIILCIIVLGVYLRRKKTVAFPKKIMYNTPTVKK